MSPAKWAAASFLVLFVLNFSFAQQPKSPSLTDTGKVLTGLPILFEVNQGQADRRFSYLAHQPGFSLALSPDRMVFGVKDAGSKENFITMQFPGRNRRVELTSLELQASRINYLIGNRPTNWHTGIPTFQKIQYTSLYPGVDLVFYGNGKDLEHDFVLSPGSDPKRIVFQLKGAKSLSLSSSGDLLLENGHSALRFKKPAAYQPTAEGNKPVEVSYSLRRSSVSFAVGSYDPQLPLIIDPVLTYSTWLASSTGHDEVQGIAVDAAGNVYVSGLSGSADFPKKGGYTCTSCKPQGNMFITKLDPTGSHLIYSTFVGGSQGDYSYGLGIDNNGNVMVGGITGSADFPLVHSYTTYKGFNTISAFMLSLSADGTQLNYSSLLGGYLQDYTYPSVGITFTTDTTGAAYLIGKTADPSFPLTPGTVGQEIPPYPFHGMFITKLNTAGDIVYSTVIPASLPYTNYTFNKNDFHPTSIAIDDNGYAYIGGQSGPGLPSTTGVISSVYPGDPNNDDSHVGFVLKLNPTATAITYATYLPATGFVRAVAPTSSGTYAVGLAVDNTFPATPGAFQTTVQSGQFCVCNYGFIAKLNTGATAYTSASYLTGTPDQSNGGTNVRSVYVDANGNPWAAGITASPDFPLKFPVYANFPTGGGIPESAFITELKPDLSDVLFSTYLSGLTGSAGSSHFNQFWAASGSNGIVYSTGFTDDTDFPTTPNSFQPALPAGAALGGTHSIIAKIDTNIPSSAPKYSQLRFDFGSTVVVNTSAEHDINVTNLGNADLHLQNIVIDNSVFSQTNTCNSAIAPDNTCKISVTFAPTEVMEYSGTMTVTTDSTIPSQPIQLAGQAQLSNFAFTSPDGNTSQSVVSGHPATYNLVFTTNSGFAGSVAFSCANLPQYATCTFTPSSVNPNGNGAPTPVTVTVATSQTVSADKRTPFPFVQSEFTLLAAFVLVPFAFTGRSQRKQQHMFRKTTSLASLLLLLAIGAATTSSCGGGGGNGGGTPPGQTTHTVAPGTYAVQLNAKTTTITRQMNVTLVVQ